VGVRAHKAVVWCLRASPKRTTSPTAPLGKLTTFGVDALGRITTRVFDAFDRVTALSEPGRSMVLVYDANGNRLRETVSAPTSFSRTRSWAYDAANRNTSTTDGTGQISHTTYYPNGELASRTDANGGTVSLTLDVANRVIATRGPRPDQLSTAEFDGVGNRLHETLANG